MIKVAKILIMCTLVTLFVTACYNDNEYDLYPFSSAACDSTNVSYSKTIVPILSGHCYVCHSTAQHNGDIILDTYAGASKEALNGNLWGGVNWETGYIPMPKNLSKLQPCDLAKIKNWINQGAPNN